MIRGERDAAACQLSCSLWVTSIEAGSGSGRESVGGMGNDGLRLLGGDTPNA
jgi:hypothetical protein